MKQTISIKPVKQSIHLRIVTGGLEHNNISWSGHIKSPAASFFSLFVSLVYLKKVVNQDRPAEKIPSIVFQSPDRTRL